MTDVLEQLEAAKPTPRGERLATWYALNETIGPVIVGNRFPLWTTLLSESKTLGPLCDNYSSREMCEVIRRVACPLRACRDELRLAKAHRVYEQEAAEVIHWSKQLVQVSEAIRKESKDKIQFLRGIVYSYGSHLSDCPRRDDFTRECNCGWALTIHDIEHEQFMEDENEDQEG